ncbi:hydantoinase/carbamoylase family amidase [Rubrobacter marinus]|uniref:Hydantoinase/carbamoylase family amidase n=1 Tax=Rubrobacter marinus TaxID=2653852 RepID=A0A6G8Q0S9_9ACTN|nr:Zn-dependent hydrolase [Rubrobacter marinus]QIN80099.1 hydantoinase/carbamoylase family amidase [Rubrobacter marinus]
MEAGKSFDPKTAVDRLQRDLDAVSRFSSGGPGITRLSFTPEYRAALDYLAGEFEAVGFRTGYDPVGNFVASNVAPGERCAALGSHVDSVPNGGRFDGTAGVLCALETARTAPDTPLKVFSFVEEEGARFGSGLLGSRCAVGAVTAEDLKGYRDGAGTSFYDAAQGAGHDPERVAECPDHLEGVGRYLEVHIEQGRVLEDAGQEIGIVEAIAGVLHFELEVEGRADHAGATPMDLRSDAGLTAAETVVEIERAAREAGGAAVGTVGRVEMFPGALNVVPGRARVGVDVRDVSEERREGVVGRIVAFARQRAGARGQKVLYKERLRSAPTPMDEDVVAGLLEAAEGTGVVPRKMVSGAGHDAMMVAHRVPTGMIFVPSRDGISHAPEEFTETRYLARAVAVMVGAVGGVETLANPRRRGA